MQVLGLPHPPAPHCTGNLGLSEVLTGSECVVLPAGETVSTTKRGSFPGPGLLESGLKGGLHQSKDFQGTSLMTGGFLCLFKVNVHSHVVCPGGVKRIIH